MSTHDIDQYIIDRVPDCVLVQCLQMFKSTMTQDFVRCKKTKPFDACVFACTTMDRVLGWGLLEFVEDTGVIQLFVGEEYRGVGVGSALYQSMAEKCVGKKIGYFASDKESKAFFKAVVSPPEGPDARILHH